MQPDSSTGNAIQDASQRYATIRTGTLWSAMPNNSSLQPEKILDSEYTPKGKICLDQGRLTS
jgi:hypothetical protein